MDFYNTKLLIEIENLNSILLLQYDNPKLIDVEPF